MARTTRKKAPKNSGTQPSQGALLDTRDTSAKAPKKRRSDDEIEADLEAKLDAVRTRKKLAAVADNKPLVAAIKASKRLKAWLIGTTYERIQTELSMVIDGSATWLVGEDVGEETDDDSSDDDGDAS